MYEKAQLQPATQDTKGLTSTALVQCASGGGGVGGKGGSTRTSLSQRTAKRTVCHTPNGAALGTESDLGAGLTQKRAKTPGLKQRTSPLFCPMAHGTEGVARLVRASL